MAIDECNTPQEVAQWVIDNRYPKSENNKVNDFELYHLLSDKINNMLNKQFMELTYPHIDGKN